MGAIWRISSWPGQLSWKTNCSREFARPGVQWLQRESFLRSDVLVKSPGAERSRDRLRKGIGFKMATRALVRHLHLPSSALRHDRCAWFELSAAIRHSLAQRADCPTGLECEVLGCLFLAARSWPIAGLTWRPLS